MSIDRTIENVLVEHPLSAFSFYTEVHFEVLKKTGKAICAALDYAFKESYFEGEVLHGADHNALREVYGLFWLWTLGAFELTRTMSTAKKCFVPDMHKKLNDLKVHLAMIRSPFAKQQPRGKREPIRGEASISGIDGTKKDICFSAEGSKFWVRDEIRTFENLIESITIRDIVATYGASFEL
jgi:hypothetical protein